jgi:hypothetical protein
MVEEGQPDPEFEAILGKIVKYSLLCSILDRIYYIAPYQCYTENESWP